MRYLGGKARLARHIVPVMAVPSDVTYVEPFIGGANVMAAQSHVLHRIGGDAHPYLIALHQAIQEGWDPPTDIDREVYNHVRDNRDMWQPKEVGFVGFCASMHGDFFRCFIDKPKDSRQTNHVTYAESGRNVLLKARPKLLGVRFVCSTYEALEIPDGAWVYCDPPYAGTAGYSTGAFDHATFWLWAERLRGRCKVFVSELTAPAGWSVLWEQERSRMGSGSAKRKTVERLFT
jgi:DNA adenine methylase